MAASLALGGLTGCDQRGESSFSEIIPYVNQPTSLTPSVPLSYASATLLDGFANGALVTTIDGRPIKIEGNAEHPWTRGATDLFMQAWVLGLYDPDRSQTVRHLSRPADWDTFRTVMLSRFTGLRAVRGQGLHLLTGPVSSPAILAQIVRMRNAFPEMHWHVHAPVGRDSVYAGAQQAFGKPVNIPRQSRGLYGVGRSKRPGGSLTRPVECEPLKAASGTANAVPGSVGH
ncbi:hypothetical protein CCS01_25680 [Rhodopila globiformis]|uniref:Uncharacterized protein n=2 Tax=Rhodopila globiformis TaxID=1071 RepID=A0A2S6N0B3_RHOGL|nr:hypothetical protein CCS01_25680 [Rhodopila globiformis]